ncbi:hypothetical protein DL768_002571 [Monosporascus sp. mg162]|nr:hypothetical protein DL768_002571 [Monosporascus sp. mg162]
MSSPASIEKAAGLPIVISAGCWRTGTASMAAAYDLLGLRSDYTLTDIGDLRQWELLKQAAESKWPSAPGARSHPPFTRHDWDRIFGSHDAITDGGADYVEELAVAYPDAKVVSWSWSAISSAGGAAPRRSSSTGC